MDIPKLLEEKIKSAIKTIYDYEVAEISIEHPANENWGDYATSIALKLAPDLKQSPSGIAKKLGYELSSAGLAVNLDGVKVPLFEKIDPASSGFINFKLSSEWLHSVLRGITTSGVCYEVGDFADANPYFGKKIIFEYTDPNPFKVFHIGHLMSNCIGESLSRLVEAMGGELTRANYQGDVGMHIAKSIWGMQKLLVEQHLSSSDLKAKTLRERLEFLGASYAYGATAYKENEAAMKEIQNMNCLVFVAAQENLVKTTSWSPRVDYKKYLTDRSLLPEVQELYDLGKAWSLEGFEKLYARLGTRFDVYYFESLVGELGFVMVKEALKNGVFEESEQAIVFRGEKHGLHTRVFINSMGLPTYEAKDLGLAVKKFDDHAYDLSFMVTANEVNDYFKVVLKALELIRPDLPGKVRHIGHGMMRLPSGKMSSRTGDVISGEELLNDVVDRVLSKMNPATFSNESEMHGIADKIAVGALKYSVLKQNIGGDIVFDREKALSLAGNTGLYLQYTYVRAKSVLEKTDISELTAPLVELPNLEPSELSLLRYIHRFPEVVEKAALEFAPNALCEYLFELSQRFNTFYAEQPILSAPQEDVQHFRLLLTSGVAQVVKNGLYLLGIDVVEKM